MALEDLFAWFPWEFAPEEGIDFGFLPTDVPGEPAFDFSTVPDVDFGEMIRQGGLSLSGADTGFPTDEAVRAALDTSRQAVPLSLGVEGTRPALVDFADGINILGRLGEDANARRPGFPGFDSRLSAGASPALSNFLEALEQGRPIPRTPSGGGGGLSIPILSFGAAPSAPVVPALRSAVEAPARLTPGPAVLPFQPAQVGSAAPSVSREDSGLDRLIPADPFSETRGRLERDRLAAALRGVF